MAIFGIIGKQLAHSYSPAYFKNKFNDLKIKAEYLTFELSDISLLPELLTNNPDLAGLNVTVPYKESVLPFLDSFNKEAGLIGSVNTIKISKVGNDAHLHGFNTDIVGFKKAVTPLIEDRTGIKALVLGTGGSAKSIVFVLDQLGVLYKRVSRTPESDELSYNDLNSEIISSHQLIINTTPLGMFPDIDTVPNIPFQLLSSDHILFDLNYNPQETKFLREGKKRNAMVENGLKMLQFQADASWKIWQSSD